MTLSGQTYRKKYFFQIKSKHLFGLTAYLLELFTFLSNLLALSFRAYPTRTVMNKVHNTTAVDAVMTVMLVSFDSVDCVAISEDAIFSAMIKIVKKSHR